MKEFGLKEVTRLDVIDKMRFFVFVLLRFFKGQNISSDQVEQPCAQGVGF